MLHETTDTRGWMRGPSASSRGALLGLVLEQPGHGGDLANRLVKRLGDTWGFDRNDVYRLLDQLEEDGLVTSRGKRRAGGKRQSLVVYYPTELTNEALTLWMDTLMPASPVRVGLQAKIAVAREEDTPRLLLALQAYERECLEQIRILSPARSVAGSWKGLCMDCARDGVFGYLQAEIDWARRSRERIGEYTARESRA